MNDMTGTPGTVFGIRGVFWIICRSECPDFLQTPPCHDDAPPRRVPMAEVAGGLGLELGILDDPRLFFCGRGPFLHSGPRPDSITVSLRLGFELHLVGAEATHHWRVHGI